jgi:hypothetical protein
MSKKTKKAKKCKCKKHGKKECPKCFQFGTYYIVGADKLTKRMEKMICHMNEEGINVYHFVSGKPGGCPVGGC